jgi:hypothetical protein
VERLALLGGMYSHVRPAEGYAQIQAVVAPGEPPVTALSAFPVELRTSSGDVEIIMLRKRICGPNRDQSWWECDAIVIAMEEGHTVHEIYPRIRALGARTMYMSPRSAPMVLFGTSINQAIRTARTWPGVRIADTSGLHFFGTLSPFEIAVRSLGANIKVDEGVHSVNNGILEVLSGDTIEVRYTQRDSSLITMNGYVSIPSLGPLSVSEELAVLR